MKKYIFAILFFLGCAIFNISTSASMASADVLITITTDSYDSRKITISLEGLTATNYIRLQEVETCTLGDTGCESITIGKDLSNKRNLRVLNTKEYSFEEFVVSTNLDYEIPKTSNDGKKLFLLRTYSKDFEQGEELTELLDDMKLFDHTLSTLSERVILNTDSQGVGTHIYDNRQYTSVRKTNVNISLNEDEVLNKFTNMVYVCELVGENLQNCTSYDISVETVDYYIRSFGDGEKQVAVFLVNKGNTIVDQNLLATELNSKATKVVKVIYLDTVGPEITIEGGKWIFLNYGERYAAQKATCKDALFENDECSVTNDANIVRIDYTKGDYQLITYEATDRLGNTTTEAVKIKVDITPKETNLVLVVGIPVGIFVIALGFIGFLLYKSHQKKKKISYI